VYKRWFKCGLLRSMFPASVSLLRGFVGLSCVNTAERIEVLLGVETTVFHVWRDSIRLKFCKFCWSTERSRTGRQFTIIANSRWYVSRQVRVAVWARSRSELVSKIRTGFISESATWNRLSMISVLHDVCRPIVLEVPHCASIRYREREVIVLRSDNGQTWREHVTPVDDTPLKDTPTTPAGHGILGTYVSLQM